LRPAQKRRQRAVSISLVDRMRILSRSTRTSRRQRTLGPNPILDKKMNKKTPSRNFLVASNSISKQLQIKNKQRRASLMHSERTGETGPTLRNDLAPESIEVWRSIDSLSAPARNVRKTDEAHVRRLESAFRTFGCVLPVLIDDRGVIIDGVVRVAAAKAAGFSQMRCIVVTHLSAPKRKLLRVSLNCLQEKGEWSLDDLREVLKEIMAENKALLQDTGFTSPEIDHILLDDYDELERGPMQPDGGAVAVARLGDSWILRGHVGEHRLVCGDATKPDVLDRLFQPGEVAQYVCTDEPYNLCMARQRTAARFREFPMGSGEMNEEKFSKFNLAWMTLACRYLAEGGLLGTFIDWRGLLTVLLAAKELGLEQLNLIAWVKDNPGLGSFYRSQHEHFPLFKKGRAPHVNNIRNCEAGRSRSNVWEYRSATSLDATTSSGIKEHPTIKPSEMLKDALLDVTNAGDIVLDPFLGSGSTLLAAEATRRRCRGIELDPLYVDLAIRRFQKTTRREAILEGQGKTFDEVALARRGDHSRPLN
jgi:DNA modification methylase